MERVTSRGVTGSKAKFVIDLPKHSLSFATKIQENFDSLETNLPSEASIDLPKVHVSAEYIQVILLEKSTYLLAIPEKAYSNKNTHQLH